MMKSRHIARIVGALFLIAMVASIAGGSLVESVTSQDNYLVAVSENESTLITGVFLELLNAIAVVGIGVLLFPIMKPHNELMALGYLSFRIVEGVFCCVIVISPLSLIKLSEDYMTVDTTEAMYFESAGALSLAERSGVVALLIPIFFSLSAVLLYFLLFHSELLPRYIAVWGMVAVALILTLNLLAAVGMNISIGAAMIFALPIILNEIFMGIWLIVRGFNPSAIAREPI